MTQNYAIAIDLGATRVRVGLVSQAGEILKRTEAKTATEGSSGEVVTEQIIRMTEDLLGKRFPSRIIGVGISSIGPLDSQLGGPIDSPNVNFPFIPLTQPLEQAFGLRPHLLNDANAAVLAERHFGDGQSRENIVYITISTGIGGGAIVNDHLLLGKGGNAAEIGHLIVETSYDFPCTCNKGAGHWEGLASGGNMTRFFRFWMEYNGKEVQFQYQGAKEIFDQVRKGDKTARDFIQEISRINARAISNILVAYDPELIAMGGSVALNNPDLIIAGLTSQIDHYLKLPEIKITTLGEDICLLGAAAAAFRDNG